jgi:hypothetical protein
MGRGKTPHKRINKAQYPDKVRKISCVGKGKYGSVKLAPIAISIAGIITTTVVAGKKTVMGAANGLGAVGKALAKFAKAALPILAPILNMLYISTILSWGAKGLAFLAQNLWIVAIMIARAIFRYLQNRRKKK